MTLHQISEKLFEIKQLYIDDLKMILSNSQNDNINKLIEKIEKENKNIIDKTCIIINDNLPNTISKQYEHIIYDFKKDMNNQFDLIKSTNNNISIDKINNIIETKYNTLMCNIQEYITKNISLSEEKINNNIIEFKMSNNIHQNNQEKINNKLSDYLQKHDNSSLKGQLGETKLEFILNKLYGNCEIIKTFNKTSCGDFIIKRDDKPTILFENKDYHSQVDKDEIIKFIKDIENNNCHGIFLSQHSSITNKKNYQIEYHKKSILIYLTFVEYNSDKISVAVDIIDDLSKKMLIVEDNNILSDELLETINNEYSTFANKKEMFLTHLKESNKKSIDMINEFELPSLCTFLSSKFANTKLKNYLCDICSKFSGKSPMSLAQHKKTCLQPQKTIKRHFNKYQTSTYIKQQITKNTNKHQQILNSN